MANAFEKARLRPLTDSDLAELRNVDPIVARQAAEEISRDPAQALREAEAADATTPRAARPAPFYSEPVTVPFSRSPANRAVGVVRC